MRELNRDDVDRVLDQAGREGNWGDASTAAAPEAVPLTELDPVRWWERLIFDNGGSKIAYQGSEWQAEELARASAGLARYAAASLKGKPAAADVNNRACCLCFADPENVKRATALLDSLKEKATDTSKKNLALLNAHPSVTGTASDQPEGEIR